MHCSFQSCVLALLSLHFLGATASPNVLNLELSRSSNEYNVRAFDLRKRAPVSADIINRPSENVYTVTLDIGTPPQPQKLLFCATCSMADGFVIAKGSNITCMDVGPCIPYDGPTFDPEKSSTFKPNGTEDVMIFGGALEQNVNGVYFQDTASIGGLELKNLSIGLAKETYCYPGFFSLGFAPVREGLTSILTSLKAVGSIASESYSVWLNGADQESGSLLIGGVDEAKYTGPMTFIPVNKDSLHAATYPFPFRGLTVNNGSKQIELLASHPSASVFFESLNFLNLMPYDVAHTIFDLVGAKRLANNTALVEWVVPCSVADSSETLNFTFGDDKISTTVVTHIRDLVIPQKDTRLTPGVDIKVLDDEDGTPLCPFQIYPSSASSPDDSQFALGAVFMRSAYLVYDFENLQMGIAQAKTGDITEEKIVEYKKDQKIAGAQTASPTGAFTGVPFQTMSGTALSSPTALLGGQPSQTPGAGSSGAGKLTRRMWVVGVVVTAIMWCL